MSLEQDMQELTKAVKELSSLMKTGAIAIPKITLGEITSTDGQRVAVAEVENGVITGVTITGAGSGTVVTLNDVKDAVLSLASKHGRKASLEVLEKYKAKNVTELKEDQYGAVLEDLKGAL